MTENAHTNAPLTRREARAIERRTGRRIAAGGLAPVSLTPSPAPFAHDTAEIERNADTALVSLFPTEVIGRTAETIVEAQSSLTDELEGSAFVRPVSIRASRPAALVTRSRRRAAAVVGTAAAAAVVATAFAVPGAVGQQGEDAAAASLVRSTDAGAAGAGQVDAPTPDASGATTSADLVAAPEAATDRAQFAVTSFQPEVVEEVVAPVVTETGSSSSSDSGSAGSNDSYSSDDSASTSYTETAGGGNSDTSSIGGIAQSMLGGGSGWLCTDFTSAVYAAAGIALPGGGVSAQAAGGTQTSNPQVGDLVVFPGHIGIYAGGGQMWDNPGYDSPFSGWKNVERSISSIGSSYYFVTYR